MKANDQLYRSREDSYNFRSEQALIDSLNHARLIEIFEIYGYPDERMIGHRSVDGIYDTSIEAMLLHTKDSIRLNYFIPKLRNFVKEGKCDPMTLGRVIDQYYLFEEEHGYQIYGTLVSSRDGKVSRIKDSLNVNNRRLIEGLPTLEEQITRDSIIRKIYGFD